MAGVSPTLAATCKAAALIPWRMAGLGRVSEGGRSWNRGLLLPLRRASPNGTSPCRSSPQRNAKPVQGEDARVDPAGAMEISQAQPSSRARRLVGQGSIAPGKGARIMGGLHLQLWTRIGTMNQVGTSRWLVRAASSGATRDARAARPYHQRFMESPGKRSSPPLTFRGAL